MEQWILWALVAAGVGLLLLSFLIFPARDVWVSFLLNAYAASFFGSIVAGAGLHTRQVSGIKFFRMIRMFEKSIKG
ncbi:hypothetical protein GS458_1886 [Geobacillus stearothermophilus]|nr:hypothetical protein GS458_1886 [Geobacillus stearothermophilus]